MQVGHEKRGDVRQVRRTIIFFIPVLILIMESGIGCYAKMSCILKPSASRIVEKLSIVGLPSSASIR